MLSRARPRSHPPPFANALIPLLISRASLDTFLTNFPVSLGGMEVTPGVLLNLLMVACAGLMFLQQKNPAAPKLAALCWGPFILWNAIEAVRSPNPVAAVKVMFAYVSYAAVFYVALEYNVLSQSRSKLASIMALSSIVPLAVALVQIVVSGGNSERVMGTMPHPNIFAFYLTTLIVVLYERLVSEDCARNERIRYGAIVALAMFVLLLTGTRSAWIGIYAFLLIYSAFKKPALTVLFLALPFAAVLIPAFHDRLFDAMDTRASYVPDVNHIQMMARGQIAGSGLGGINSYVWRKMLWAETLSEIWKSPYIGHGLESFPHDVAHFFVLAQDGVGAAHNIYIQMLYESGIFGLISFIWISLYSLIYAYWKKTRKSYRTLSIYFLGIFLIESYSDNMLYYLSDNWYFWFCFSTYLAYCYTSRSAPRNTGAIDRSNWMVGRVNVRAAGPLQ